MSRFYDLCPLTEKRVKATPWTDNLCDEINHLTVQINHQKDSREGYSVAMTRYLSPTNGRSTFHRAWDVASRRF